MQRFLMHAMNFNKCLEAVVSSVVAEITLNKKHPWDFYSHIKT